MPLDLGEVTTWMRKGEILDNAGNFLGIRDVLKILKYLRDISAMSKARKLVDKTSLQSNTMMRFKDEIDTSSLTCGIQQHM